MSVGAAHLLASRLTNRTGEGILDGMLTKLKAALAKLLGDRYAVVVNTVDRAVTAFGLAFLAKIVGGTGFGLGLLASASWWETTLTAGVLAACSVLKSGIVTSITGSPALLSLLSHTLRNQRQNGARPQHTVPVRRVRKPVTKSHDPGHAK